MRRLVDPESSGIVESGVTEDDAARAELLTQIDFMMLPSSQRQQLTELVYTDLSAANAAVARAKQADDDKAKKNTRERMSYEQLALLQISEENPTVQLTQFLDTVAPEDEEGRRVALDRWDKLAKFLAFL
jgi:hypothetical protein